jgi:hypothetical protein
MSKAIRLSILVPLALAWLCGSALAQGGVTNSTKNPQQIAILHWYPANLTANFPIGADSGPHPNRAAFDGANIWVFNPGSHSVPVAAATVTKVRASDGAVLGTFTVDPAPPATADDGSGIAFDGANIWVINQHVGLVKLRASDGKQLLNTSAILAPPSPDSGFGFSGVAFDGANIWVGDNHNQPTVHKLRASDGAHLLTIPIGNIDSELCQLAFDGANIWVTECRRPGNTVTKVRASDGALLGTFTVGSQPTAFGVVFDGANIWVANVLDHTVMKLRPSDGTVLGTFGTSFAGGGPSSLAFDGANIWVTGGSTAGNGLSGPTVNKLRASDGASLGVFTIGTSSCPADVVFDGANVWVVDCHNSVSKL